MNVEFQIGQPSPNFVKFRQISSNFVKLRMKARPHFGPPLPDPEWRIHCPLGSENVRGVSTPKMTNEPENKLTKMNMPAFARSYCTGNLSNTNPTFFVFEISSP